MLQLFKAGSCYESAQDAVRASHEFLAMETLSSNRYALRRGPTGANPQRLRATAGDGVCADYYRKSMCDIEAWLSAQAPKLYHMGMHTPVARSTLADANERRDWRIYAEHARRRIVQARALYASQDIGLELSNTV